MQDRSPSRNIRPRFSQEKSSPRVTQIITGSKFFEQLRNTQPEEQLGWLKLGLGSEKRYSLHFELIEDLVNVVKIIKSEYRWSFLKNYKDSFKDLKVANMSLAQFYKTNLQGQYSHHVWSKLINFNLHDINIFDCKLVILLRNLIDKLSRNDDYHQSQRQKFKNLH